MKPMISRFRRIRAVLGSTVAAGALVVACVARDPSNVTAPDSRVLLGTASVAPADSARPTRGAGVVRRIEGARLEGSVVVKRDSAGGVRGMLVPQRAYLVVDGVRLGWKRLDSLETVLDRNAIESVEVLKGAGAVEAYGPEAADGVIYITTKDDPRPRRSDLRGIPGDTVVILDGKELGAEEGRRVLRDTSPGEVVEVRVEGVQVGDRQERSRTTIKINRSHGASADSSGGQWIAQAGSGSGGCVGCEPYINAKAW
jgi:TonB-dependent SusC/RagA subfamily outer membrane receptor